MVTGFHPVWQSRHEFRVQCVDLAHLALVVRDKEFVGINEILCYNAIPLSCLREGHRFVPMLNQHRKPIPNCGLYCHFLWADA
jgi:hypothetical protein